MYTTAATTKPLHEQTEPACCGFSLAQLPEQGSAAFPLHIQVETDPHPTQTSFFEPTPIKTKDADSSSHHLDVRTAPAVESFESDTVACDSD